MTVLYFVIIRHDEKAATGLDINLGSLETEEASRSQFASRVGSNVIENPSTSTGLAQLRICEVVFSSNRFSIFVI